MKKFNLKDIIAYIQGNLRYKLYYSNFAFLIRKHIREQIDIRIKSMDKECYDTGQCKMCGCETTALQMANKACDKPCYPEMMNDVDWWVFKKYNKLQTLSNEETWGYLRLLNDVWTLKNNKFVYNELEK